MEEVKFETPWTDRISNWNKFKPFASWYHANSSRLYDIKTAGVLKVKGFHLSKIPAPFKIGKKVRDPQKMQTVVVAVYVPVGYESVAKDFLTKLGYTHFKKVKSNLWRASNE